MSWPIHMVVGLWRVVENFHKLNQIVTLDAATFVDVVFSLEQTAQSLMAGMQVLLWQMFYCP